MSKTIHNDMTNITMEYAALPEVKFDADGVLHNALICGFDSVNGYGYTKESFQDALSYYDKRGVFLDHPEIKYGRPVKRRAKDRLGTLQNPYLAPDGVRADYHALTSHSMYATVKEDLEKNLGCYGFSHLAETEKSQDGKMVVKIKKVYEVDLCPTPNGTTRTLLETDMENKVEEQQVEKPEPEQVYDEGADQALYDAVIACLAGEGTPEEKVEAIEKLVLDHYKAHPKEQQEEVKEEVKETVEINTNDLTIETLNNELKELKKIVELQSKYFTKPMSEMAVETSSQTDDRLEDLRNKYRH